MTLPRWLAEEIDELGRSVKSGELDREHAVGTLVDHAFEKDELYIRGVITAHLSGKLDNWLKQRRNDAGRRAAEAAAGGRSQGGFDDICSDYWPRDTYGPLTTLEDLEKYNEEMRAMTDRFAKRDDDRDRRLQELIRAAGGNKKVTWEQAERWRLDGAVGQIRIWRDDGGARALGLDAAPGRHQLGRLAA
jgi:hypothetical protein